MRGSWIVCLYVFKQKTAYEIRLSLMGSEMHIRDRVITVQMLLRLRICRVMRHVAFGLKKLKV